MTARSDVVINWSVSPRIITVLSPSTDIIVQDLLDTCREAEDDLQNLIYSQIASASGKENLGGGTLVGLTVKLLDAVLAFEARPGPTYAQCRVSGGNLVAIDSVGSDISPIYPTAFTQILTTASSSATIISGSGGPTASDIADAVWNKPKSSFTTDGSLGKEIATNANVIAAAIVFK